MELYLNNRAGIIRRMSLADIESLDSIIKNAYPGILYSDGFKERAKKRFARNENKEPNECGVYTYGYFLEDELIASFRIHSFKMSYGSTSIPVWGLGGVAVGLLYKKMKVAHKLLENFLSSARQNKIPLTALYPFRYDFYKHFGFGFGGMMYKLEISPEQLFKSHFSFENFHMRDAYKDELLNLVEIHNSFVCKQHGLFMKSQFDLEELFEPNVRTIVCLYRNKICGYFSFKYEKESNENFMLNNIVVQDIIYENAEVLQYIFSFFKRQSDQFRKIKLITHDYNLIHLVNSPESNDGIIYHACHDIARSGIALMYKITHLKSFFEKFSQYSFGSWLPKLSLKITAIDNFDTNSFDTVHLVFKNGIPHIIQDDFKENQESCEYICHLKGRVDFLSSVLTGSVSLDSLLQKGLLEFNSLSGEDKSLKSIVQFMFSQYGTPGCNVSF